MKILLTKLDLEFFRYRERSMVGVIADTYSDDELAHRYILDLTGGNTEDLPYEIVEDE